MDVLGFVKLSLSRKIKPLLQRPKTGEDFKKYATALIEKEAEFLGQRAHPSDLKFMNSSSIDKEVARRVGKFGEMDDEAYLRITGWLHRAMDTESVKLLARGAMYLAEIALMLRQRQEDLAKSPSSKSRAAQDTAFLIELVEVVIIREFVKISGDSYAEEDKQLMDAKNVRVFMDCVRAARMHITYCLPQQHTCEHCF